MFDELGLQTQENHLGVGLGIAKSAKQGRLV